MSGVFNEQQRGLRGWSEAREERATGGWRRKRAWTMEGAEGDHNVVPVTRGHEDSLQGHEPRRGMVEFLFKKGPSSFDVEIGTVSARNESRVLLKGRCKMMMVQPENIF